MLAFISSLLYVVAFSTAVALWAANLFRWLKEESKKDLEKTKEMQLAKEAVIIFGAIGLCIVVLLYAIFTQIDQLVDVLKHIAEVYDWQVKPS